MLTLFDHLKKVVRLRCEIQKSYKLSLLFFLSEESFFKHGDVDEQDNCAKFKRAYNNNAKVIMDNHPLMIMAKEGQRVSHHNYILYNDHIYSADQMLCDI